MSEKHVLVEHSSIINTIIRNTFQATQRIKFTTFDVSPKYIIFGATSGGLYIFIRDPCQFLKLIPSTHGPTTCLKISQNEEHLAIAVAAGHVIVLEGCFTSYFEQQVYSEHEGSTVTAMVWNGNDLYCGDSTGRVSVITLKNFLTKAMFQTPASCLMHLDSQIVQLETYSKFLLVSTLTRSLLCDTETERYRQIGKKMRDGPFGACFLHAGALVEGSSPAKAWGPFKNLGDNEELSPFLDNNVKVYSARPGARLWQADFQGNVVLTHQFRGSLGVKHTDVVQWSDKDALNVKFFDGVVGDFSFGRIYPLLGKFILTFNHDGIYIFEPSCSALKYWSAHLSNIKDVKVVDSLLYVWHNDLEVSVLALWSVEEIILRSLVRKKYQLCGGLCCHFLEEVENFISSSKKIHLISALENKLQDPQVLEMLGPIFQKLRERATLPTLEKLKNGIVTVNALPMLPEPVQNFDPLQEKLSILSEQYKVNKINGNIETTDFLHLMKNETCDNLYDLLKQFQSEIKDDCDSWCKDKFLKHSNPDDFTPSSLEYAHQAFLEINHCEDMVCECTFPLPRAHKSQPKYYEIGCKIIEKTKNDSICTKIPYMYKSILSKLNPKDIHSKIPLIIQFSDQEVIETYTNHITYDLWDESVKLLIKLKSSQCLNCGVKVDPTGSLDWSTFGVLMTQSIKPSNAIKLLKRYANLLPKGDLNPFFYQYCILSTINDLKGGNLKQILCHENVQKEFEQSVGGFLRRKHLGDYEPPKQKPMELLTCDHCRLALKMAALEDNRLKCGHNLHRVCFLYNNMQCPVCGPAS